MNTRRWIALTVAAFAAAGLVDGLEKSILAAVLVVMGFDALRKDGDK